jgi:hypothetical protein
MFKRKARRDEYESDGVDDEEDVEAQKRKRASARNVLGPKLRKCDAAIRTAARSRGRDHAHQADCC